MPVNGVLGEHQIPINRNVKDTTAAWDKFKAFKGVRAPDRSP